MQGSAGQNFIADAKRGFIAAIDADKRVAVGAAHHNTGQYQVQAGQRDAGWRLIG